MFRKTTLFLCICYAAARTRQHNIESKSHMMQNLVKEHKMTHGVDLLVGDAVDDVVSSINSLVSASTTTSPETIPPTTPNSTDTSNSTATSPPSTTESGEINEVSPSTVVPSTTESNSTVTSNSTATSPPSTTESGEINEVSTSTVVPSTTESNSTVTSNSTATSPPSTTESGEINEVSTSTVVPSTTESNLTLALNSTAQSPPATTESGEIDDSSSPTDTPTPTRTCLNEVSVLGDATYCVDDIPCGGEGSSCPRIGDVAWNDCHSTLPSANNGTCIAPTDATCEVIRSVGAIDIKGCVWSRAESVQSGAFAEKSLDRSSGAESVIVYGVAGLAMVLAVAAVVIATSRVPTAPSLKADTSNEESTDAKGKNEETIAEEVDDTVIEV